MHQALGPAAQLQQLQQLGQLPELCHLSIPDLHLASHPAPGGALGSPWRHGQGYACGVGRGPSRIGFVTSRSGESADSGERGEREERKSDDCGRGRRGRGAKQLPHIDSSQHSTSAHHSQSASFPVGERCCIFLLRRCHHWPECRMPWDEWCQLRSRALCRCNQSDVPEVLQRFLRWALQRFRFYHFPGAGRDNVTLQPTAATLQGLGIWRARATHLPSDLWRLSRRTFVNTIRIRTGLLQALKKPHSCYRTGAEAPASK
mmetsp:Transcript_34828/g.75164  ORF Transcript_34828/g.75164 Transcript_34828/m.75164 type:complete len:260 (+) Transcript_34828:813-1592(+)